MRDMRVTHRTVRPAMICSPLCPSITLREGQLWSAPSPPLSKSRASHLHPAQWSLVWKPKTFIHDSGVCQIVSMFHPNRFSLYCLMEERCPVHHLFNLAIVAMEEIVLVLAGFNAL